MTESLLTYNGISVPEEDVCGLPVRLYHHIFFGRVSQRFKIYGVHHQDALIQKTDKFEVGDLRIADGSRNEKDNEFYEAAVECWNGREWVCKSSKNGFFPDSWSRSKVMKEIALARKNIKIDDWLVPAAPQKKSNAYVTKLSGGQQVVFFLGIPKKNKPARLNNYIVTVFPYFDNRVIQ